MLFTFIGNGSCETTYNHQCVSIDDKVTYNDFQYFIDEWKTTLPENKLDCFGDIDTTKLSIEELVAALPDDWNAEITNFKCDGVFV